MQFTYKCSELFLLVLAGRAVVGDVGESRPKGWVYVVGYGL